MDELAHFANGPFNRHRGGFRGSFVLNPFPVEKTGTGSRFPMYRETAGNRFALIA